jgi:hypothetical protein
MEGARHNKRKTAHATGCGQRLNWCYTCHPLPGSSYSKQRSLNITATAALSQLSSDTYNGYHLPQNQ